MPFMCLEESCNQNTLHVATLKCYPEPKNVSAYFPHNTDLLEQEHIIKIWSLTPTLLAIEIPTHDSVKKKACIYISWRLLLWRHKLKALDVNFFY